MAFQFNYLPPIMTQDEFGWWQSREILIKSKGGRWTVGFYQQDPDKEWNPQWVMSGRDGYTIDDGVACWVDLPTEEESCKTS